MTIRPIVTLPDPLLRMVSESITRFDADLAQLVADMAQTMVHKDGIGLAAVQIGVPKRVLIANPGKSLAASANRTDAGAGENALAQEADAPKRVRPIGVLPVPEGDVVMVNPKILSASQEESAYQEGCLSIPDMFETVFRPARIRLAYQDITGAAHELEADGIFATIIQHELDHLNGVLFIDYISRLKRDKIIRRFEKRARQERQDYLERQDSLARQDSVTQSQHEKANASTIGACAS